MKNLTIKQRCEMMQKFLPHAPYRDMLTVLHTEMLLSITSLESEASRFRADAINEKSARQTLEFEIGGYQSELVGYESSTAHLSRIIDDQRALLEEVEKTIGVDDFGVPLEDGENPLLDKIRAMYFYWPGKAKP